MNGRSHEGLGGADDHTVTYTVLVLSLSGMVCRGGRGRQQGHQRLRHLVGESQRDQRRRQGWNHFLKLARFWSFRVQLPAPKFAEGLLQVLFLHCGVGSSGDRKHCAREWWSPSLVAPSLSISKLYKGSVSVTLLHVFTRGRRKKESQSVIFCQLLKCRSS